MFVAQQNHRLPTAEEWEYAALAGASTKFDWGPALGKNRANCEVSRTCMGCLIRGAAWSHVAKSADPRLYTSADPTLRESFVGFRLARSTAR